MPGPARKLVKHCTGCGRDLPRNAFYERANGQVVSRCRDCSRGISRACRPTAEKRRGRRARYTVKIASYQQKYNADPVNKARRNAAIRERITHDRAFAIEKALRRTLADKIRKAVTGKAANTLALLGCSVEQFLAHIEGQWRPGMSWANWGRGRGRWNLDHKQPIASFNLADPQAQRACFHWSNFQPLWSDENLRKGAKIEGMCGV